MYLVLCILSNPNISIGLHICRCYFFSLSRVDNHLVKGRSLHFPPILNKIPSIQNLNETTDYRLYFIYVRVCLFLCSAHIELGH